MAKKDDFKLDLRQAKFVMFYCLPNSETYSNAYKSALKAGFTDSYARNITTENLDWMNRALSEITGAITKNSLIQKSKEVIQETLEGKDKRLAQDSAKFVLKTDTDFSDKHDITSNGESVGAPVALVEFVDGQSKDTDTSGV